MQMSFPTQLTQSYCLKCSLLFKTLILILIQGFKFLFLKCLMWLTACLTPGLSGSLLAGSILLAQRQPQSGVDTWRELYRLEKEQPGRYRHKPKPGGTVKHSMKMKAFLVGGEMQPLTASGILKSSCKSLQKDTSKRMKVLHLDLEYLGRAHTISSNSSLFPGIKSFLL